MHAMSRTRPVASGASAVGASHKGVLRTRLRAARRQLGVVLRHPSNTGHRWSVLWTAVRFELADLLGRPVVVPFADHSTVLAQKGGDSSSRAAFARLPDWPEMQIWQEVLQPGDRFVDVGANVGLYSLLAGERGCEVIAVEPAPDMAKRLRDNAARNGRVIEVHEVALMDRHGRADLDGPDPNRRRAALSGSGPIEVMTLDEIVAGRTIRGMKIDVEGNERLVLAGGHETLSNPSLELVQLEWNTTSIDALGEDRSPVAAQLRSLGFALLQAEVHGTVHRCSDDALPPFGADVMAARGHALELLSQRASSRSGA
jgi:FkbM family methyltransferase